MKTTQWYNELEEIKDYLLKGKTVEEIGEIYGVSKQRIYQVMTKFGLLTNVRTRKNILRGKEPKYYWFNKMLTLKKIEKEKRTKALETFILPDFCPMLNIKLNYNGTGREGFSREDNSPSIDKINPKGGYIVDNIQVISWRANRIKNDSTPEELMQIALYMQKLTK